LISYNNFTFLILEVVLFIAVKIQILYSFAPSVPVELPTRFKGLVNIIFTSPDASGENLFSRLL
jgi:hypothetical protein